MDADFQNEGQVVVESQVIEPEPLIVEENKNNTSVEEKTVSVVEEKTDSVVEETADLSATTVDVIPIVEEPASQPIEDYPVEDVTIESNLIENKDLTEKPKMTLVPVKGNPKVMRCTTCNTFVSRSKGHDAGECAANLRKRDANRGKKRRCNTKKCIARKGKTLAKKYCKKKGKIPKEVKDFLQKFLC